MSAGNAGARIEAFPPDYKDLDEDEPESKRVLSILEEDTEIEYIPQAERIIRVILEEDGEKLAVTDLGFYVLFTDSKTYYARSSLFSLITSEHAARSKVVSKLVESLRAARDDEKPFLALSMLLESTPERLFLENWSDLTKVLVEHGRSSGVLRLVECRGFAFSNEELDLLRVMYRRFCAAVEILNARCSFGVTDSTVCLLVGGVGVVLDKPVVYVVD